MKNVELSLSELEAVAGAGAGQTPQDGGSIGQSPNVDVDVDPI